MIERTPLKELRQVHRRILKNRGRMGVKALQAIKLETVLFTEAMKYGYLALEKYKKEVK